MVESPRMNASSLSAALAAASEGQTGQVLPASAAMRVYMALRARIVAMDLLPDTVLSRADIAREHSVSQSPVREAIQKLEHEGLVVSYPQSKTLVTRIDIDLARETQFLRLGVEIEVAKTLARAGNPELLLPATRILRMQQMAGDDRDIAEFMVLDRLFHLSLFKHAGVESLSRLIAARSGHIDRLRLLNLPDPGKMAAVVDLHERILAAIGRGDLDEVEAEVRIHLSGTLASLPAIIETHPDFF